jgi:valyl-tRNA synthetase
MICVFNDDGSMNSECGQFSGLMRFECRRLMLEKMKEIGCYRDTKPNPGQKLPLSQRTGDIIEPMLKPQWWVASKDMATKAADAVHIPPFFAPLFPQSPQLVQVRSGIMDIKPAIFKDTWYQWLDNIKDWCISRQLWWGHRIPAWCVPSAVRAEAHVVQRSLGAHTPLRPSVFPCHAPASSGTSYLRGRTMRSLLRKILIAGLLRETRPRRGSVRLPSSPASPS